MIVTAVSNHRIETDHRQKEISNKYDPRKLIGKRLPRELLDMDDFAEKEPSDMRIAFVCNWNSQCGISTYSRELVESIQSRVKDIKVFSEIKESTEIEDEDYVDRCWSRGESLNELIDKIHEWNPDFVIIQHEFGIFPNAFYFMQLMERIRDKPHVVTMHSVYKHLDKTVYTEAMSHIIVHSEQGRQCLKENGNTAKVYYIPHACKQFHDTGELWNNLQSPYTVLQFGFGFRYKGVEVAMKAISHLVKTDSKFENLFYIYLCSENAFNSAVHDDYYEYLRSQAKELGIENNICIMRKYQTDRMLSLYIRLAKVCIFPYVTDPDNVVYGESGAIRVAMSHNRPVIASDSRMFSDLDGVVPRPSGHLELAKEIDEIFSNAEYRQDVLRRTKEYVDSNSWGAIAEKYIDIYNQIVRE